MAEGYAVPAAMELSLPQPADAELLVTLERGASVEGFVLDPAGQPVAGARVGMQVTMASLQDVTRSFVEPPEAITEADGSFRLEHLSSGSNSLVAQAEDFAASEALGLDLAPGEQREAVVLTLRVGARLTGEVYGSDGLHQAGVQVIAQIPGDLRPAAAVTDEDGWFELEHLTPGTYQVISMGSAADDDDAAGDDESGLGDLIGKMKMASAELRDGEEAHVVLGAPPEDPVRLEGRVLCAGTAQTGVLVNLIPEGEGGFSALKMTTSDAEGRFALDLGGPGPCLLSVQRVGAMGTQNTFSFSVEVPETDVWEYDVELPAGGIRGRVRAPDGSPAAGVRVSLNSDGPIDSGTIMGNRYTEMTTAEDGTYAIDWVPADTYSLAIGGAPLAGLSGGKAGYGRQIRTGLEVREGQWIEGVDFRLREPATIEGRVRNSSGQPVSEAAIFLRDENGVSVERISLIQTDGAGRFSYGGLNPGHYTVLARRDNLVSAESTPVRVVEDGSASVDLELSEGAFLIVQLEENVGEPIQGSVRVTDSEGRQVNGVMSLAELMGAFNEGFSSTEQRVGPLPPGPYRVAAFAPDGRETKKSVSLRAGSERRLKLRLRN